MGIGELSGKPDKMLRGGGGGGWVTLRWTSIPSGGGVVITLQ